MAAENEITIAAPPERVFAVLSDPERYVDWVVGTRDTHGVDEEWPAEGAKLAYEVGAGPATFRDYTEVVASEPPHRLVLRARMRPIGDTEVELLLERHAEGTLVRMREEQVSGIGAALETPVSDVALAARNAIALRRLRSLVEGSP